MGDLEQRFRDLDRLDPPEVWPEVVRRGPRPPTDASPSRLGRVGITVLALAIAAASLTFAIRAFRADTPTPLGPTISNGKIAFAQLIDTRWQIKTIEPDGSSLTTLGDLPGDVFHPAWSPDGSRIAFDIQTPGGVMQIFAMNADGTGLTQLTSDPSPDPGWNSLPAWSPDGTRIAFVSSRDGNDEIYVMRADGSEQTRLTNSPDEDLSPSWNPAGTRIAFASNRTANNEIYSMTPDGSGVTRLTEDRAFDAEPAWSPDGARIAFASDRDGPGLYVMNADGSGVVRLTNELAVGPLDPAWSPDGRSIAYTTSVEDVHQLGIYVVDMSTGARDALLGVADDVCCPSWQPVVESQSSPSVEVADGQWPAVPTDGMRATLEREAAEFATANGGAIPASAEVVLTTRQTALNTAGGGDIVNSDEPVYLLQMLGEFTSSGPRPLGAAAPKGSVFWFLYDPAQRTTVDWGLGREPTDLSMLGEVSQIEPG